MHCGVYLKVQDYVAIDGKDSDWTVSTAAFNLLDTLFKDYIPDPENQLIPHCGHTMWAIETEPEGLYLGGCNVGIDWEIEHRGTSVIHRFNENEEIEVPLADWRTAVCQFSDAVREFLFTAWPKNINDEFESKGFLLFMNLWENRRAIAYS